MTRFAKGECCSFLAAVVLLITGSTAYNESVISQTMKDLLDGKIYDRRIRPHIQDPPLSIEVSLAVSHFGTIRERDMDFTVDLYLRQYWNDQRLKHSLPQPIRLTGTDKGQIWLPDTFFLDLKSAIVHNVPSESSAVVISNNGDIFWSMRVTVTTRCHMDLRDYPLDKQTCNLTLLSYAFKNSEVKYRWRKSERNQVEVLDSLMSEFIHEGIDTHREELPHRLGTWTYLTASFVFKRRLGYAVGQIYIPTVMIVLLSWLSFWIDERSVPARVALGGTTVLTIVTLMGSFRDNVPKVSYVKALDVFFVVSFLFVFGVVLEYIAVLYQVRKKAERMELEEKSPEQEEAEPLKPNKNQEAGNQEKSADLKADVETRKASEVSTGCFTFLSRKRRANKIDRASRILFPCVFFTFNLIYWLFYSFENFYPAIKKVVRH